MDSPAIDRLARGISRRRCTALAVAIVAMLPIDPVQAASPFGPAHGNGARCSWNPDCKSNRCQGGRCRQGRTKVGGMCDFNQACKSGVCGRMSSNSKVCRQKRCIKTGDYCAYPDIAWSCCEGLCDATTATCVRSINQV